MDTEHKSDMKTEEVLEMMEQGASLSEEQIQNLKNDPDLKRACEDVHIAAHLLRQEKEDFDVEERLKQFYERHSPSLEHKDHRIIMRRLLYVGGIAAAAVVVWAVFFLHTHKDALSQKGEKDVLFAAIEDNSQPLLTNSKGKSVDVATYLDVKEGIENAVSVVAKVKDDNTIPMDTMRFTIPYGKDYTVLLPDGSRVKLHPGSRISYPTRFIGNTRQVSLSGEAYFMVAKDATKPFIVKTGNVYTKVLGTEFNVKSWEEQGVSNNEITLVEGSVQVSSSSKAGVNNSMVLKPGQQAKCSSQSSSFDVKNLDTYPYTMWRDNFFYFDNINMKEVLLAIGQRYNMSVVCHNKEISNLRVRFIAERDSSINYIIDKINGLGTVSASIENRRIVVR